MLYVFPHTPPDSTPMQGSNNPIANIFWKIKPMETRPWISSKHRPQQRGGVFKRATSHRQVVRELIEMSIRLINN